MSMSPQTHAHTPLTSDKSLIKHLVCSSEVQISLSCKVTAPLAQSNRIAVISGIGLKEAFQNVKSRSFYKVFSIKRGILFYVVAIVLFFIIENFGYIICSDY